MIPGLLLARVSRALAFAGLVLLGMGCGSAETARMQKEITTMRAELDELRKAREAQTQELAQIAERLKAMDAQSEFLVGEARTSGDQRQRVAATLAETARAIQSLRASVEELERKTAAPRPALAPARPAARPTGPESTAEKLFAQGMTNFRAEEHGQAVLEFSELTDKFPTHPLAASAQYWIAEAYYRQRDFQQALVEFEKVRSRHPDSPQVPEALLKIGLCHRALHDVVRAREAWEQLAKTHPTSEAANQARALLAALGPPGRRPR